MSHEPAKSPEKSSNKLIYAVVALLALLLIVWLAQKNTAPKVAEAAPKTSPAPDATAARNLARPAPSPETGEQGEEPKDNGPRAYLVEDFTDANKSYDKYKLENVQVTPNGLTLAPGAEKGTIESPTMVLQMPSSTTAFLWKQDVPKGSGVKVEMAVSADNQSWSPWYPVDDMGDDINPLYPDGSPNPNYGYVPGTYVSLGLDLVPFIRYRMTLLQNCSDCKEYRRPDGTFAQQLLIPGARIWHYNGTGQDGTLAKTYPPGVPTQQDQNKEAPASGGANNAN